LKGHFEAGEERRKVEGKEGRKAKRSKGMEGTGENAP